MIKQFIISLLMSSIIINSMDVASTGELVLHNRGMLSQITYHLCAAHEWDCKNIRPQIATLSMTDKTLKKYYKRTKTRQNIIRNIALNNEAETDFSAAEYFDYRNIVNQIDYLFLCQIKGTSDFTKKDLKQLWYLNCTKREFYKDNTRYTPLLAAIKLSKFETAKKLILAGVNCHAPRINECPLALMAVNAHTYIIDKNDKNRTWFDVIKLLLEKGIHPDSRHDEDSFTLLHGATFRHDAELARLLLLYNANPYKKCWLGKTIDAFELEPRKGWLAEIIKEVEQTKKNVPQSQ